jgi:hypothetical protein
MPRFFFNVHDGKDLTDNEGTDLPDANAARNEAVSFAGSLLRELNGEFWLSQDWHIRVTDDAGETVCALRFSTEPA